MCLRNTYSVIRSARNLLSEARSLSQTSSGTGELILILEALFRSRPAAAIGKQEPQIASILQKVYRQRGDIDNRIKGLHESHAVRRRARTVFGVFLLARAPHLTGQGFSFSSGAVWISWQDTLCRGSSKRETGSRLNRALHHPLVHRP